MDLKSQITTTFTLTLLNSQNALLFKRTYPRANHGMN